MGFMEGLSWGTSKQDSRKIYDAFMEEGGNFIDTANTYGDGVSEEYLGEFMAAERDRVVLSTKYAGRYIGSTLANNANCSGSHRKSLVHSVETSLKRLKTDYIDLLWVHSWDFMTPVEEVMRALDDLVRQGKLLYIGVSNAPAWIVAQANTIAELRGWTPFIALQVEYNLIERDVERELLPMARALDIGVTAWTPLSSGLLTGKYNQNGAAVSGERAATPPRRLDDPMMSRFAPRSERSVSIAEEVTRIAREMGSTPAQVALNWIRRQGVIPIFGARTAGQVKENMGCFDFNLSEDHIQRLNQVSKIRLGFPHDFLASTIVKTFVYGGMFDLIDNHRNRSLF
jgi:aryl-alcohol dehydrogenase-like predicted oxidoreductase